MSPAQTTDINPKTSSDIPVAPHSELLRFRWWYKGKTPEGNTIKFEGHVRAKDSSSASDIVEREQRARFPEIVWMQGKEIEGNGVQFGPTVQQLKGRARKNPVKN